MPPTTPPSTIRQALGGAVSLGLLTIAAAGIIFSFTGLRSLAMDCGIPGSLAWLIPVTIDAASLVAARIWLLPSVPEEVRRWACQWMGVAIGLSVGGNIIERAAHEHLVVLPWWAIVVVAAVPSATLAAVVHLAALVVTSGQPPASQATTPPVAWRETPTAPTTGYQVTDQPAPAAIQGAQADSEFDALMDRARALRREDPTIGRSRLATWLQVGDHTARRILAQLQQETAA